MPIANHLFTLETAGLITLANTQPEIEYLFRHALIQDVVVDSLLKSEQHQLHRWAGEALEQLYGDRREELASRLAEHFWQAGDAQRALPYFMLAAEQASRSYDNREAIEAYSRALKAAAGQTLLEADIRRERGTLYEITGDFELAQADQEEALRLAGSAGDRQREWQALINLGILWAARDYRETGRFFTRALELARLLQDDRLLAASLNRVGNYYINLEEPDLSYHNHIEALEIFTRLEDERGIAETRDFLGMSSALGGDLPQGIEHLKIAVALFERMGDLRSQLSSMTTLYMVHSEHQTDTMAASREITARDSIRVLNQTRQMAVEIGWWPGEVYSLCNLAIALSSAGNFSQALKTAEEARCCAEEIQHLQWKTFAYLASGSTCLELLDLETARDFLERGISLAEESNSAHWIHVGSGVLAEVLIHQHDYQGAAAVLERYLPEQTPARTRGQRLAWAACCRLALAQANPERAMEIVQRLMDQAIFHSSEDISIGLWYLKGLVLMALAEKSLQPNEKERLFREAEQLLRSALEEARLVYYRTICWRLQAALARLDRSQGRLDQAEQEERAAQELVQELAGEIDDAQQRSRYLKHALAELG